MTKNPFGILLCCLFLCLAVSDCSRKCAKCSGRGVVPKGTCGTCSGSGKIEALCESCGGAGTLTAGRECMECRGKGEKPCGYSMTLRRRGNSNEYYRLFCANGVLRGDRAEYIAFEAPRFESDCGIFVFEDSTGSSQELERVPGRPLLNSRTCSACYGRGSKSCTFCSGMGSIDRTGVCDRCQGAGSFVSPCSECEGSGRDRGLQSCSDCGGTGRHKV